MDFIKHVSVDAVQKLGMFSKTLSHSIFVSVTKHLVVVVDQ